MAGGGPAHGSWEEPRPGKEVYTGQTWRDRDGRTQRFVFRVVRRTIAEDGQRSLVPELGIDTWWTSRGPRTASAEEVIEFYHGHATSQQFHSKSKTERDLERLPSGKLTTDGLILSLVAAAVETSELLLAIVATVQSSSHIPSAAGGDGPTGPFLKSIIAGSYCAVYWPAKRRTTSASSISAFGGQVLGSTMAGPPSLEEYLGGLVEKLAELVA